MRWKLKINSQFMFNRRELLERLKDFRFFRENWDQLTVSFACGVFFLGHLRIKTNFSIVWVRCSGDVTQVWSKRAQIWPSCRCHHLGRGLAKKKMHRKWLIVIAIKLSGNGDCETFAAAQPEKHLPQLSRRKKAAHMKKSQAINQRNGLENR